MDVFKGTYKGVYTGRRILVTGETGFKGSWLSWWLKILGAEVTGVSLPPPTEPSLYRQAGLESQVPHREGDIRDAAVLHSAVHEVRPELVFHLAAQTIVRESYRDPLGTMSTNVMGTVHLLEAVRLAGAPCTVVVVTSDKCYENRETGRDFTEADPMGGRDVYSASKGCAEIATSAYRRSFFPVDRLEEHRVAVASARAGNVLGFGDWAADRLVPDCIRALEAGEAIPVRNPDSIRPWQHVLESLSGYLWLGAMLLSSRPGTYAAAWNFGPDRESCCSVRDLVEVLVACLGDGRWEHRGERAAPPEAEVLRLDVKKAREFLHWHPVWDFMTTAHRTGTGYLKLSRAEGNPEAVRDLLTDEISAYTRRAGELGLPWAGNEARE